jgi:glutamate racemase
LVLACTHYSLIEDKIRKYTPSKIRVISQGQIVAQKLKDYLERHPDIESRLEKGNNRQFFSTEDSWRVRNLFKLFYGKPVEVKKIVLK